MRRYQLMLGEDSEMRVVVADVQVMSPQTLKVHLRFDPEEFQWIATINRQRYAAHRFENRAMILAKQAYLEQLSPKAPKNIEFVMDIEWPSQMRMAYLETLKAKAAHEAAKEHYDRLLGQYIAGWIDYGLSLKGAAALLDIAQNTAARLIQMSGDTASAAKALWKLVPPPPENGAIGRVSVRTNPKYLKTETEEEEEEEEEKEE